MLPRRALQALAMAGESRPAGDSHILLVGGSGLVGRSVLERLRVDHSAVNLARTAKSAADRAISFEALWRDPTGSVAKLMPQGVDVAISCLGSTSQAGSTAAMRRVDVDYVEAFARGAKASGARQFILVSAAGAGGTGSYLKMKAEAEWAIMALGYPRVDIVRPGLLLGKRGEFRLGERLAQVAFPYLEPLLVGRLAQFQGIPATTVAEAIVQLSGETEAGVFYHFNRGLRRLGQR